MDTVGGDSGSGSDDAERRGPVQSGSRPAQADTGNSESREEADERRGPVQSGSRPAQADTGDSESREEADERRGPQNVQSDSPEQDDAEADDTQEQSKRRPRRGGPGKRPEPGGSTGIGGVDPASVRDAISLRAGVMRGTFTAASTFVFGLAIAVMIPNTVGTDILELGAVTTLDLHFATPGRLVPALAENFDSFRPSIAMFGLLYLLAPLLLYRAGMRVASKGMDDETTLPEAIVAGSAVVLGYLPVMAVLAIIVPTTPGSEFSIVTAVGMAGLVYPLVFGGIGGIYAGYLTAGDRDGSTSGSWLAFFGVFAGLFVASYSYVDVPQLVEFSAIDRVWLSVVAFVEAHALSMGEYAGTAFIPYLVVGLVVALVGFLGVKRSDVVRSPAGAFVRGSAPAATYLFLLGVVASVTLILSTDSVLEAIQPNEIFLASARTISRETLVTVGDYVRVVAVGTVVYPVAIGGLGGTLAWWIDNREAEPTDRSPRP